jgi:hypothetical protein
MLTANGRFNRLLKKSEKHLNPSFRRKPEGSLLLGSNILDPGFRRGDEAFFSNLLIRNVKGARLD